MISREELESVDGSSRNGSILFVTVGLLVFLPGVILNDVRLMLAGIVFFSLGFAFASIAHNAIVRVELRELLEGRKGCGKK